MIEVEKAQPDGLPGASRLLSHGLPPMSGTRRSRHESALCGREGLRLERLAV